MSDNDSSSPSTSPARNSTEKNTESGVVTWLKKMIGSKTESEEGLRDVIEEYIEEMSASPEAAESNLSHELLLLTNILSLRDMTAEDVMVPRADIMAVNIDTPVSDIITLIVEYNHHRIPVYRETLDDIVGIVHMKDILKVLASKGTLSLKNIMHEPLIVSPALSAFDLILLMREKNQQMVFVVDEYGGIDGLVTIGDVVANIIGDAKTELTKDETPTIVTHDNGTYTVDARIDISEFEEQIANILTEADHDNADTLGGFIFTVAGRVPVRGELITHDPSGYVFEILDADPRRVLRVNVKPPINPVISTDTP